MRRMGEKHQLATDAMLPLTWLTMRRMGSTG